MASLALQGWSIILWQHKNGAPVETDLDFVHQQETARADLVHFNIYYTFVQRRGG